MSTPFAAPLCCANGREFVLYVAASVTVATLYEEIHPTTPAKYCGDVRVNVCEKCRLFAKVTQNHPNFLKKRRICYILPKVTPIFILPKNDQIITNIHLFYSFIKYSVPLHKNRSTKPFSAKVTAAENPKHE